MGSIYEEYKFSMLTAPRKPGEFEVLVGGDEIGKILLEKREAEDSLSKQYRDKFLPEVPGFRAEKLTNLAAQEKYLDGLVSLAVAAHVIQNQSTEAVGTAILGAAFNGNVNPVQLFRLGMDAAANVKKAEVELKQMYAKKIVEFLHLQASIMKAERRDWAIFKESERDRAYVSQNRLEWFFLGNALTGLHQSVQMSVAEMSKAKKEAFGNVEGGVYRELADIPGRFMDRTLSKSS